MSLSARENLTKSIAHSQGAPKFWEPRTRLVSGIIFILGITSLRTPLAVSVAFIFVLLFALANGINLMLLLKRLAVFLPLLAIMSLPLMLGAGLPVTSDRLQFALRLVLKVFTAAAYTQVIFFNQPVESLLQALAHLKIPALFTTVIYLAYRYGFLFLHEIQVMLRALKARLFELRLGKKGLYVFGEIAGGFFIKSLNRSDAVYRSLISRGFDGRLPVGSPYPIGVSDLIKTALPLVFCTSLMIVEQVVF